jgi:hypothetical protein
MLPGVRPCGQLAQATVGVGARAIHPFPLASAADVMGEPESIGASLLN